MDCKFLHIFRRLTGGLLVIGYFCIICICYGNPAVLFSIQHLLRSLDISVIGIYNHMIYPGWNPDIIPAFICAVCFHLFARPRLKCIISIIIPCPDTWIFPVLWHLYIYCFLCIRCFVCFYCLRYHGYRQYCHKAKCDYFFHHFTHKHSSYTSFISIFQNYLRAFCLIS